jgi:broad-specificity NMP kinase
VSKYALGLLGLPGTGKSSAMSLICSASSGLAGRSTDQFHMAGSRMTSYIARLLTGAEREVALACQVEALAQRAILQRTAGTSDCIDEPVEAVLAHTMAMQALGMFPQDQYESWMLLYDVVRVALPHACFLALLNCDRQELQRRTVERGRLRDGVVSDDYLDALDESLRGVVQRSSSSVIVIDTTLLSPREVASAILSEAVPRLRKRNWTKRLRGGPRDERKESE